MTSISFLNKGKYIRAKEVAGDDDKALIKEYKRLGGSFVEGTNAEIERVRKYEAIYDKKSAPKAKEAPKASAPKKKGKKK